ncbi:MAG: FHA domain-containing protein, partial [Pirellulales bacterium]
MESLQTAAGTVAPSTSTCQIAATIEHADGTRSEILVPKAFARIGRDRRAEIALDDVSISPCHALLHATPGGIYCTGLAAGVASRWLLPDAPLEFGGFRIHARVEGMSGPPLTLADLQDKQSATPPFPEVRVFLHKPGGGFSDCPLKRRLTLVGREPPATWRIKHPTLSRLHGAFVWEAGELWLIDLFSSNGTRVSDHRFDAGVLNVGQVFSLGSVRCCYLGPAAEPTQAANGNAEHGFAANGRNRSGSGDDPEVAGEDELPGAGNGRPDAGRWQALGRRLERLEEQLAASQTEAIHQRQAAEAKLAANEQALAAAQETIARTSEQVQTDKRQWLEELQALRAQTAQDHANRLAELDEKIASLGDVLRAQAVQAVVGPVAEMADGQPADDEEIKRQQRLTEELRGDYRALQDRLDTQSAELKNLAALATDELCRLSESVTQGQSAVEQLAAEVARHGDEQSASAEAALGWQDLERRLEEQLHGAARRAEELSGHVARLTETVEQELRVRSEISAPAELASPALGPDAAAELGRLEGEVDVIRHELARVAADAADARSHLGTLEGELGALAGELPKIASGGDRLARRIEQETAALAQQILAQRDELLKRIADGQAVASELAERADEERKAGAARLEALAQTIDRVGAESGRRLAGEIDLIRQELAKLWPVSDRATAVTEGLPVSHLEAPAASAADSNGTVAPSETGHDAAVERSEIDYNANMAQSADEPIGAIDEIDDRWGEAFEESAEPADEDRTDEPIESEAFEESAEPADDPFGEEADEPIESDEPAVAGSAWDDPTQRLLNYWAQRDDGERRRRRIRGAVAGGVLLTVLAAAGAWQVWVRTGAAKAAAVPSTVEESPE